MTSRLPIRRWDRASALPLRVHGGRRAELVTLPPGRPDLATAFTFMRDAELRFSTLRLRIEERTTTANGPQATSIETLIRHPGSARVTTTEPGRPAAANYEVWTSDGVTVRTYSSISRVATRRQVRRRLVGLDDPDLPGRSRVYTPLTPLPMESLPEAFVHPAGLCQNVLSTGMCRIAGRGTVAGREALLIECDHPRTTEVATDLPDHRLIVAVDAQTGIVSRLVEIIGNRATRDAEATVIEPDAPIPDAAFEIAIPSNASLMY